MNSDQWMTYGDDHVVVTNNTADITVAQLKSHVASIQSCLSDNDIRSCAIFTEDTTLFIAAFLACVYTGVEVVLPANTAPQFVAKLDVDGWIGDFPQALAVDLLSLQMAEPRLLAKDSTVSLFTSGSTGEPKRIKRLVSQLLLEVRMLEQVWGQSLSFDRVGATVSHQHIYGLLFKIIWPLMRGTTVVGPIIPYESSLSQWLKIDQTLLLVASPAFLKRVCNEHQHQGKLCQVISSGGMLTSEQHAQAANLLQAPITQVYGSSETGGMASRESKGQWQWLPGVESKIENGVLWVQSPYCYQDGWHCTQDAIELNGDGFELLGRIDRIVKIEEYRVALSQVELALLQSDWIADAAVIKLSNNRQFLAAAVQLSESGRQQLQQNGEVHLKNQIKQDLLAHLDKKAIPKRMRFIDEALENSQGKRSQEQLQAWLS